MAARDYDWLLSALASWNGNRTDLTARLPDFIMLAEKRLNGELQGRLQESVVTISSVSGTPTVLIPSDVSDIRSLSIAQHGPLDYITPEQYEANWSYGAPGVPQQFTVIGTDIHLGPTPDAVYALRCAYRALLPALADAVGGSNWLIANNPDCYLAAAMCEVLAYTKNLAELPVWEKKYADAVASVNQTDWHSGSTMRIRSDAGV